MKVKGYQIFKCDAGWRTFSFLKLTTDSGPIGWSEYNESFGSPGLAGVIENLMTSVVGMDPMDIELVNAVLATRSTQSRGGVVRQAVAAIENALLDIKGKALGVPVYQLFGGKLRDRIPVYWSHCGSCRMRTPAILGPAPRRALPDRLGRDPAGAPRLPALLRGLRLRHRHRRRDLERLLRIAQDRGHVRRLRGERGAAQFLRPSRQRHQRAFLRRGAEL